MDPHSNQTTTSQPQWMILGLTGSGLAGVVLGTWLPWIDFTGAPPLDLLDWFLYRHGGPDLPLLGFVALGLAVSLAVSLAGYRRIAGLLTAVTGVITMAATLELVVSFAGRDGTVVMSTWGIDTATRTWAFVGPGVYVTLGGGALLLVGGVLYGTLAGLPSKHAPGEIASPRSRTGPAATSVTVLLVLGVLCVALGSWLGGLVLVDGSRTSITGTGVGISQFDGLVLGIAGGSALLSLGILYWTDRRSLGSLLSFVGGFSAIGLPIVHFVQDTGLDSHGGDVVAPGLYVTLFGGFLLLVASALASFPDGYRHRTPATQDGSMFERSSWHDWPVEYGLVVAVGVGLVVLATRLHWLVPIPIPEIRNKAPMMAPWMNVGFIGSNGLLLGVVVAGALFAVIGLALGRFRSSGYALSLVGGFALGQTLWRLASTVGTDGIENAAYVVGPGAYLAMGGGGLLLACGMIVSAEDLPPPTTVRSDDSVDPDTRSGDATAGSE